MVFNGTIALAGGGAVELARRERHQVLFNAAGSPIHLYNGAMGAGSPNDHTFTVGQPIAAA